MPLSDHDLIVLALVLGAGSLVEAVAGFGGTVLALSLGARWFTIEQLLGWFLPLNLLLSIALAGRGRRAIHGRLLATRILPMILIGLAAGTALAWVVDAQRARALFAGLVVLVAVVELAGQLWPRPRTVPDPNLQRGMLLGAGVVHGLFATGGPLAVAVIGRMIATKAALRATLAVMWLTLNVIVLTRLASRGHVTTSTLTVSAALAPAMLTGLGIGELLHARASEQTFRRAVAALLLVTGALLLHASLR